MNVLDIEGVLGWHVGNVHFDFERVTCQPCGKRFESWADHRTHVADQLRKEVARWLESVPWTESARDDLLGVLATNLEREGDAPTEQQLR